MWDKLKEQFNLLKLEKKKLCLITNSDKFVSKDDFLDAIASALQGGVDMVLFKETTIPDGVAVDIGRKIRVLCDEYGATFIVYGRVDIAQIVEADGVHLEQDGISVEDSREILPQNAIVGQSVYNTDEIDAAISNGADYVIFKPLFAKGGTLAAAENIMYKIENVKIPVFIVGDITPANINKIVSFGVKKIAVGESLMYAKIPELLARDFVKYL